MSDQNKLGFTLGSTDQHVGAVKLTGTSTYASFYSVDPNTSVRSPMTREVYESFRPNESIPLGITQEDHRKIMILCKSAYDRVGVIKSVIDMMSEFAVEGIEIIHPDAEPNKFYKAWQKKIKLEDRAERALNWLYKNGNFVMRRRFAQVRRQDLNKIKIITQSGDAPGNGRIPLEYVLYDPSTIELVGGSIGALSSKKMYAIRVPMTVSDGIRTPRNTLEEEVFEYIPEEIKDALKGKTSNGLFLLKIPEDKIYVAHYKKDDSDLWGKSFIYSILGDVFYNDKLKLAKTSALDGYRNVLRVWKLGDHTHDTPAAPDAGSKLASILENNVGGGSTDLIWDSAIDVKEYYPPLGDLANFEENIDSILLGLGVPDNLVGGVTKSGSNSSVNSVGLKNLIKRLEAGRRAIIGWLEAEIDIIQKEMGFKKRPVIRFSNGDLYDERTFFDLLIQLVDRNIISDQTILERINELPEIEAIRVKNEEASREAGDIPPKASPYHKPDLEVQHKHEIKKLKITAKPEDTAGGPDNSSNLQRKVMKESRSPGRPQNSRDTVNRSRGPNKKIKASFNKLLIDAYRIYDEVDTVVKNKCLEEFSVANIRQLNKDQDKYRELITFSLFSSIEPFTNITDDSLVAASEKFSVLNYDNIMAIYESNISDLGKSSITLDQKRTLLCSAFAQYWCDYENI